MSKAGIKIVLMLTCLVVFITQSVFSAEHKKQIVCLGDQITNGNWREEMIGNGTRWVDVLASYAKGMEVINAGTDGMFAGDIHYLNNILKTYPDADIYVIYLGINDLIKIDQIDPAAVASVGAKILRMVRTIKTVNRSAEIAIVAPQRINYDKASETEKERGVKEFSPVLSDMLDGSLEVVAKREDVHLVRLIDEMPDNMLADGVMPNIKGHEKIAELIWDSISEPEFKALKVHELAAIAPPPVGTPLTNKIGTESIIEGVSKDNEELRGVGSNAGNTVKTNDYRSRAKSYIDKSLSKEIVSKAAYEAGKGLGNILVKQAEEKLLAGVDKIMNNQFAPGYIEMAAVGQSADIIYKIPEPSRVESFITDIAVKNKNYEILADAVNWDKVSAPENREKNQEVAEKKSENTAIEEKAEIDAVVAEKQKPEPVNLAKAAEKDIIETNNEIIDVWLPELELGEDNTAKHEKTIELAEAEKLSDKITDNEVEEVFAGADPIEYTGYEVLVHTGINE